ncbi:LuxR C-terminal-related transcriptional regulator [Kitasatospora sp. NPDC096147]|uniref:LuxR C-terminal-related transcriptional regulator n=1 Tax=Kitasatospora sp. NPDC096147 TaxID=3364093 RepID=UPI0037FD52A2
MAEETPEDGFPDEAAQQLYRTILTAGGRVPFTAVPESEQPALEQLLRTGLVIPNIMDKAYVAVSPRSVSERMSSELRADATRLLLQAEQLPDALGSLTRAYDAVPRGATEPAPPALVVGQDRIRHRIAELVSECAEGVLAAQPGPRDPQGLAVARHQDLALLRRGAGLRSLYQPMTTTDPVAVEYAKALAAEGGEVRVLDEPYQRMLIIDRKVAVVPAEAEYNRAAFVTDPAAVAFLVAVFERDWARAEMVDWGGAAGDPPVQAATRRVGRLLATGLTQKAVATRLGLSERTVAGHISRLREQYGAQTLFQLGWRMRDRSE